MRFLFSGRKKTSLLVVAAAAVMGWVCSVSASFAAPFSPGGRIFTLAGDGTEGFSGDGGPARAAQLNVPNDSLALPDGSVLIADRDNHRVRKVDASGTITTFAGNGSSVHGGDGGPATAASFFEPSALAALPDGSVLIAEFAYVRRVSPEGIITTFAGDGSGRKFTEGVDADKSPIGSTGDIDVMADGSVLIASRTECAILVVRPSGKIYRFAGNPPPTGRCGYSGDGGPAKAADIGDPISLAVATDNSVYLLSSSSSRVRRIDAAGNINLFAGKLSKGFSGDGGPAKDAEFNNPLSVAVAPDDSVFVADSYNQRIRRIDARSSIVSTYADGNHYRGGPDPEGILAASCFLSIPVGVNVDSRGHVFVSDYGTRKVRFITPTIRVPGGGTP